AILTSIAHANGSPNHTSHFCRGALGYARNWPIGTPFAAAEPAHRLTFLYGHDRHPCAVGGEQVNQFADRPQIVGHGRSSGKTPTPLPQDGQQTRRIVFVHWPSPPAFTRSITSWSRSVFSVISASNRLLQCGHFAPAGMAGSYKDVATA